MSQLLLELLNDLVYFLGMDQLTETGQRSVGFETEASHAINMPQTNRTLEVLADEFAFKNTGDLLGKIGKRSRVLVLGSGTGAQVEELRQHRPNATVVDLNPAFADEDFRNKFPLRRENVLAGFNPTLPFADKSFDLIIDDWASIYYAKGNAHETFRRIVEILRVLNKKGTAIIGPMNIEYVTPVYELLQNRGIRVKKVKYRAYPKASLDFSGFIINK